MPDGICKNDETAARGISVRQLLAMYEHVKRRCVAEGWTNWAGELLVFSPRIENTSATHPVLDRPPRRVDYLDMACVLGDSEDHTTFCEKSREPTVQSSRVPLIPNFDKPAFSRFSQNGEPRFVVEIVGKIVKRQVCQKEGRVAHAWRYHVFLESTFIDQNNPKRQTADPLWGSPKWDLLAQTAPPAWTQQWTGASPVVGSVGWATAAATLPLHLSFLPFVWSGSAAGV